MTAVPIKRGNSNTETDMHRGKRCEDTEAEDGPLQDWGDASTGQGTTSLAGKQQKLEETRRDSPPDLSEREHRPATVQFGFLASTTTKQ